MGHSVKIPTDALLFVGGDLDNDDLEKDYRHCVENDIIRTHFKLVEESDAVLVLNHDKTAFPGISAFQRSWRSDSRIIFIRRFYLPGRAASLAVAMGT